MASERTRRVARRILSVLGRAYGRHAVATERSALEELLLGIISNGTSERSALVALGRLSMAFVDWNEVRVSAACETAAAMSGVANAMEKAEMIRAVLQRVFDRMNEMSLEPLRDRSPRDSARLIAGIDGFPEEAVARATIYGLGHTALPLTPRVLSVCRRIDFVSEGTDLAAIETALVKVVPKQKMYHFHWLLSRHAVNVCVEKEPLCPECKLLSDCRGGRARMKAARESSSARRVKKNERKRSQQ